MLPTTSYYALGYIYCTVTVLHAVYKGASCGSTITYYHCNYRCPRYVSISNWARLCSETELIWSIMFTFIWLSLYMLKNY